MNLGPPSRCHHRSFFYFGCDSGGDSGGERCLERCHDCRCSCGFERDSFGHFGFDRCGERCHNGGSQSRCDSDGRIHSGLDGRFQRCHNSGSCHWHSYCDRSGDCVCSRCVCRCVDGDGCCRCHHRTSNFCG